MSKTVAGETEVTPAFLLQLQKLISLIKTKNPNPLPIGIKFGFLQCGGRGWIRTTEVVDGRFTVCSLWPLGNSSILNWSWWTDSNPRPADYKSAALPTELHQHILLCSVERSINISQIILFVKSFFEIFLIFLFFFRFLLFRNIKFILYQFL